MSDISFSKEEKAILVRKLQLYFNDELKQELGRFDAEFLLHFIGEEIGAYFYNRGLQDAQAILSGRLDDLTAGFTRDAGSCQAGARQQYGRPADPGQG